MQAEVDLVPLMMQEGYRAKEWLGLILGQSMYYAFFKSAVPTDEKFMQQMDALVREIGDRGKTNGKVSEGVPPRAPAPAFEPTPEPAPAAGPTPSDRDITPSKQLSSFTPMRQHLSSSESPALVEQLLDLARSDRVAMEAKMEQHRQEAKIDRAEMEAKFQQQLAEAKAERHEMQRKPRLRKSSSRLSCRSRRRRWRLLRAQATEARMQGTMLRERQLVALQARLEALHAAKLLADAELHAAQDAIADEAAGGESDGRVAKLISLSSKMASDKAFARQLQRQKWL
jgi:hypothetical protein